MVGVLRPRSPSPVDPYAHGSWLLHVHSESSARYATCYHENGSCHAMQCVTVAALAALNVLAGPFSGGNGAQAARAARPCRTAIRDQGHETRVDGSRLRPSAPLPPHAVPAIPHTNTPPTQEWLPWTERLARFCPPVNANSDCSLRRHPIHRCCTVSVPPGSAAVRCVYCSQHEQDGRGSKFRGNSAASGLESRVCTIPRHADGRAES